MQVTGFASLPSMLHHRFGSSLIRSYVSQTTPLFKKRHGRSKVKALLKKNHDENLLSHKIQILEQQLDKTESVAKPSKECPRIKPVEFIAKEDLLTDEKEISQKIAELQEEVIQLRSNLHTRDLEFLELDIGMIMNGSLSLREIFGAVRDFTPQLENPNDRALFDKLMGWWKTSDSFNFFEQFSSTWDTKISKETKDVVLRDIGLRLKDSGLTTDERILDAVLDALHPLHKENYLTKVRNIKIRRHVGKSEGRGESMFPTLWTKGSVMLENTLHPQRDSDVLDSLKVGDIVRFIVLRRFGETRYLTKRLMGLPGDVVTIFDGKSYIVPKGYFWALGDNPGSSIDSRHFGAIPSQNLRSQVFFAYSRNNLGFRFFTSKYEFHFSRNHQQEEVASQD